MELSAECGVAPDSLSHAPDSPWNADCVHVDQHPFRDAGAAPASFHSPLPVVAFDRGSPIGSRDAASMTVSRETVALI